jgi:predicted Zn-dependent peptidase
MLNMTDRLHFEKTVLPNGITSYFRKFDVEYTTIFIRVPFGSAHNTGEIIPGTFHFLEHMCMNRSEVFPEFNQFGKEVGLHGGWSNAHTAAFETTYEMSIPTIHLEKFIPGFLSIITNPIISEQDIANERTIVINERMRRRWYPGSNEQTHYLATQWGDDEHFSLQQIFGFDEDLGSMTPEYLQKVQKFYFDPRMEVVAIGSGNIQPILDVLGKLQVEKHELPYNFKWSSWARKDYHEHEFDDINRFELLYGGLIDGQRDISEMRKLNFIGTFLTNPSHGPLYNWLRSEKGWVYNLGFHIDDSKFGYAWSFDIPLSNKEQVEIVRNEWWPRATEALKDKDAINREVDRILNSSAYWYENASDILGAAMDGLQSRGRIIEIQEWRNLINECRDSVKLQELFDKYYKNGNTSSMCCTPKLS